MKLEDIQNLIRDVPDFPKPGIVFKDITPLVADPRGFAATIDHLASRAETLSANGIMAIESRGFIFGAALARQLNLPMHLVRKRGKLPREVVSMEYDLEYGTDQIEVHADAIEPGRQYLVVDDLIATGGTAAATVKLIEQQQARVAGCLFVVELAFLNGRDALRGHEVSSLLTF